MDLVSSIAGGFLRLALIGVFLVGGWALLVLSGVFARSMRPRVPPGLEETIIRLFPPPETEPFPLNPRPTKVDLALYGWKVRGE